MAKVLFLIFLGVGLLHGAEKEEIANSEFKKPLLIEDYEGQESFFFSPEIKEQVGKNPERQEIYLLKSQQDKLFSLVQSSIEDMQDEIKSLRQNVQRQDILLANILAKGTFYPERQASCGHELKVCVVGASLATWTLGGNSYIGLPFQWISYFVTLYYFVKFVQDSISLSGKIFPSLNIPKENTGLGRQEK